MDKKKGWNEEVSLRIGIDHYIVTTFYALLHTARVVAASLYSVTYSHLLESQERLPSFLDGTFYYTREFYKSNWFLTFLIPQCFSDCGTGATLKSVRNPSRRVLYHQRLSSSYIFTQADDYLRSTPALAAG